LGFFRRDEPAHVRLAREGGLVEREPRAPWREVGVHGVQRAREWDATVTTEAEGIDGDGATFVALPDGSLMVEEGPDSSLQTLADAVERELRPPYRARAARVDGDLWGIQARRIEVIALPNGPGGDVLDLAHTDDGSDFRVDGERVFGSVRALEERGAREGRSFAVHAERLDGDLWEVRASAL
jgi:hypothetical protein